MDPATLDPEDAIVRYLQAQEDARTTQLSAQPGTDAWRAELRERVGIPRGPEFWAIMEGDDSP